jgi:uncharacterized protein
MRIAITGSTGLVGKALIPTLQTAGNQVVRLVRGAVAKSADATEQAQQQQAQQSASWQPDTGAIDLAALGSIDAVIHLAGENVAGGRWTKARKQRIANSRGPVTEKLCRTLASLPQPPKVLISASAIGIYGDRGPEELHEQSDLPADPGFLTEVAMAWEAGTQPLAACGTRIVHLRIGIVLDRSGGALARMLPPFRFGLGGRLGDGHQWMSWITLHDLVRAVQYILNDDSLRGPVLAVAPTPIDNREFTRTLGKVLHRPTFLPVPRFALQLLFGEMASLLFASLRARPHQLLAAGFPFDHANLEAALRACLGKN